MNKTPTRRACNLFALPDKKIYFNKPQYFLYILVNNACQAKCKFCTQANNSNVVFNNDKLNSTLDMLIEHTEKTGTAIRKINFTGGEPLIDFEKFKKIFNCVNNKFDLSNINVILNTNGININSLYEEENILKNIKHVSFSRHHYDDILNRKIFNTDNVPSSKDLKKFIAKYGEKVWLRCNEIKGYIDSEEAVEEYCKWAVSIGCKHCGFSTLMALNDFCKDNFVDIKIPTSQKFSPYIDHFKYDDNDHLVCNCMTTIYEDENGFCDIVSWSRDVEAGGNDGILVFDGENLKDDFFGDVIC